MKRLVRYIPIVIFLISIVILAFYFNTNQGYWWDEAVYLGLSKNVYDGNGYWINVPDQEAFRPPVFTYLTVSVWSIFGVSETIVKLLPPIFAILSVILIYFFVRRVWNREIGLWSALILGTSHLFLFYSEKFLTESLFIFLGIAFLYVFYLGMETKKKYLLIFSGIIMAVAFLTRYLGWFFVLIYILYPIFTRKPKRKTFFKDMFIKNKSYWIGLILFFIILIPWFQHNLSVFGSLTGGLTTGLGTVTEGFYIDVWYFYFINWFTIFGFIGIFAVPGIAALLVKLSKPNRLLLMFVILSVVFFALLPRKELRYLLHFFEIYIIMFGIGVYEFRKWIGSKNIIPIIAVLFCIMNVSLAVYSISDDVYAGASLKDAGLFLSERVPSGKVIMSNNIPVMFYLTGNEIVYFPANESMLNDYIREKNVSYMVIESREPSYPDYVWNTYNWQKSPSDLMNKFSLEKTFDELNKTYVWVYRV